MALYAVKCPSAGKLVEHAGVLVVGGLLGLLPAKDLFNDPRPLGVIVHATPDAGVVAEVVRDLGPWQIERMIADEGGAATARLRWVLANRPQYSVWDANCEHLQSYVETGEAKSPQLRGAVFVGALAVALWGLGGPDDA